VAQKAISFFDFALLSSFASLPSIPPVESYILPLCLFLLGLWTYNHPFRLPLLICTYIYNLTVTIPTATWWLWRPLTMHIALQKRLYSTTFNATHQYALLPQQVWLLFGLWLPLILLDYYLVHHNLLHNDTILIDINNSNNNSNNVAGYLGIVLPLTLYTLNSSMGLQVRPTLISLNVSKSQDSSLRRKSNVTEPLVCLFV
jgi:hypothetical protein